jgi:hypothetical protein
MTLPYTVITGLSFPKGSDREYIEEWNSLPDHPAIHKTISGHSLLEGKERCALTISGNGDRLPECTLNIGDVITVTPLHLTKPILLRFKGWTYKHISWQFSYSWTYSFIETEAQPKESL